MRRRALRDATRVLCENAEDREARQGTEGRRNGDKYSRPRRPIARIKRAPRRTARGECFCEDESDARTSVPRAI